MSCDPVMLTRQHTINPQRWNLYTYTANNPLNRLDPDGKNWFKIGNYWQWHEGSKYTYKDDKGKSRTVTSSYTHLLTFKKTGTNEFGATTGVLTLYMQAKPVANAYVFSGGNGSTAIPNGEFTVRLDNKNTAKDENATKAGGTELKQFYGIQEIAKLIPTSSGLRDHRWEWGSKRAALNERLGEQRSEYQGNYIHGKERPGDYTHGCICNRDEKVLDALLRIDSSRKIGRAHV